MRYIAILLIVLFSCTNREDSNSEKRYSAVESYDFITYAPFTLKADLSQLSDNQKEMVKVLIEAATIMDQLFWYEAYGDGSSLLEGIEEEELRRYASINYGPWDRLNNNAPFLTEVEQKPDGANFYPADMTREEFENWDNPDKQSLYTFIRRDENGNLVTRWYHEMFAEEVKKASDLLKEAASLAEDVDFRTYLESRAEALLTDDYLESDMLWMDTKTNPIELVYGPIETYEDQLFGYKAAHEAYVLIKDLEWSGRLQKYAAFLPELQQNLPAPDAYKQESPGSDADLNAYDVVYYAGDCNAGSKTIAINLPNDERVQLEKGTRRLQLKNAMQAKFDKIMVPITRTLIDPSQQEYVNFDAFFANTMFHEVAHGLGIKNTINGSGTVREALKEHASALEEGKADILGLYMVSQLLKKGEVEGSKESYYTTFVAGIFRSVRFGASSAHGRANMIRFNYLMENGAVEKTDDGYYKVNMDEMDNAIASLSELILTLQGDGNYDGVAALVAEKGVIGEELQRDLDRLNEAGIPVDIVFEQGIEVLGLND